MGMFKYVKAIYSLLIAMLFLVSCSSKTEDEWGSSLQWKGKVMCLYGDSTLDIIEL